MSSTPAADGRPALLRAIGAAGIGLVVINSMIGAGIFALPDKVVTQAGLLSPWLFLLVGVLFLTIVLSFAELTSYFRESGGPILYASTAFGPLVGFSTGWLLYISRMTAFAANLTVMATYLGVIWPWIATDVGRILFIMVTCVGLTTVNYVGVKNGVRALAAFTLFKVTPILILVLVGLKEVSGDVLLPAQMPDIDDMGGLVLLIVYAFIGFESAAVVSGETRNPRRTMPRAMVATVLATTALYFLIMLVYVAVLPEDERSGKTLADVASVMAGDTGALVIGLAAVFSIGDNLASNMLSAPRLTFALSKQNLLPEWLGRIHPRYQTPANSVLFLGVLCLVLALSGTFVLLAGASSLARMISYGLSIGGLPRIRKVMHQRAGEEAFRLPLGMLIPGIALLLCVWIAFNSPAQTWMLAGGQLAVGLVLYFFATRARKSTIT